MANAEQKSMNSAADLFDGGLFRTQESKKTRLFFSSLRLLTLLSENEVVGAAYFAPEQVSHSLWNTYFLSVNKDSHRQGIGRHIMTHTEELARLNGINTLIVETSSLESFSRARSFYLSLGYVREAEIRDYYAPGENQIVFWKSLA